VAQQVKVSSNESLKQAFPTSCLQTIFEKSAKNFLVTWTEKLRYKLAFNWQTFYDGAIK
jgi:hypothetical protein